MGHAQSNLEGLEAREVVKWLHMKRISANHYQTSERYYKLSLNSYLRLTKDMKLEVKVVYAVLKDRLELSFNSGWIDDDGAMFI